MKGTGAKRNVCPGSCVSTGAKFPVAPVSRRLCRRLNLLKCAYFDRLHAAVILIKGIMSTLIILKNLALNQKCVVPICLNTV